MVTKIQGTLEQIQAELSKALARESPSLGPTATAILILEPARVTPPPASDATFEKLMAEAYEDAVSVGHVDDSREAIYTRMEGE